MYLEDAIRRTESELERDRRLHSDLVKMSPQSYQVHEQHMTINNYSSPYALIAGSNKVEKSKEIERRINEENGLLEIMRNDAKLFLIDDVVRDSLYNERFTNPSTNNLRLPFPAIFFQFQHPLPDEAVMGAPSETAGRIDMQTITKAVLLTDYNLFKKYFPEAVPLSGRVDGNYRAYVFGDTIVDYSKIPVNLKSMLPEGSADKPVVDSDQVLILDFNKYDLSNFYTQFISPNKVATIPTANPRDGIEENLRKLLDLNINLINYINSRNVVVRQKDRVKNPKINEKRKRDGKLPLNPYYWIEVKKEHVEPGEPKNLWELKNRVWVRGHFRHYENEYTIWIEPFVKGPPNAPWKHNRYQVLSQEYLKYQERQRNGTL